MRILGIVALGAALGGCASSASDITPAYVSPVAYQGYTCQQLALEAQAISTRAATLSGSGQPIIGHGPIPSLVSIMPHFWLSNGARLVDESSQG
jgi:hypothetical protein